MRQRCRAERGQIFSSDHLIGLCTGAKITIVWKRRDHAGIANVMRVLPRCALRADRLRLRPHRHSPRSRALLERAARRTIRDIHARELERPPAVVAAAGVELRGMVREGEQVSPKKLIEAKPCGVELSLGLFEPFLRDQHVGKAPSDLRIAARKRRQRVAPPRRRFDLWLA